MANVKTNTVAGKRTENKTIQSSTYKKKVETVVPQDVAEKNQDPSEDTKAETPQVLTEVKVEEKVSDVKENDNAERGVEEEKVEMEDVTEEMRTESHTGVFVAQHLTPSSRIRGTYGATKFC